MGNHPSKGKKTHLKISKRTLSQNSAVSTTSATLSLPPITLDDKRIDLAMVERAKLAASSSRGRPRSQTFANVLKESLAEKLRQKEKEEGLAAIDSPPQRMIRSNSVDVNAQQSDTHKSLPGITNFNIAIGDRQRYQEYERLQKDHYLFKLARKSNYWAPINRPDRIIHVACQSGIWAHEMAIQFPYADVIGIDINPPTKGENSPRNLTYIAGDPLARLPFEDNTVDYIYQRNAAIFVKKERWLGLLREFLRILKPGGFIEISEEDLNHHNGGPQVMSYDEVFLESMNERGIDWQVINDLDEKIKEAGFTDVIRRYLDLPLGEWADDPEQKQFGFLNLQSRKLVIKGWTNFLTSQLGIPQEEFDDAIAVAFEEFESYHAFTRHSIYIGRKPGNESEQMILPKTSRMDSEDSDDEEASGSDAGEAEEGDDGW